MRKLSTEDHRARLKELNCELLSTDVPNTYTKVQVKFADCGHVFFAKLNDIYTRKRCADCGKARRKVSLIIPIDEHRRRLADLGYELVADTVPNAGTKVAVKHIACGHVWHPKLNGIYSGNVGCPLCWRKRIGDLCRTPIEEHRKRLKEIGYELVDNSVKSVTAPVLVRHLICGCAWPVRLYDLYRLRSCPKCSIRKREKETGQILLEMFERVARQCSIRAYDYPNILYFDYQVQDNNTMVEYHGEQHYRSISFFGGDENFEKRKLRDRIKEQWCKRNGYNLIVVPYWIDDIKSYLTDQFLDT